MSSAPVKIACERAADLHGEGALPASAVHVPSVLDRAADGEGGVLGTDVQEDFFVGIAAQSLNVQQGRAGEHRGQKS